MQARMNHPIRLVPDSLKALLALSETARKGGLPPKTILLAHVRASQINGCSFCVDMHSRELKEAGESDKRIWSIAAWRETPWYDDAERAALALTEALTRTADRADPVPDDIWNEARKHYSERALADLILQIAIINSWNRINIAVREPAGSWTG